MWADIMTKLLQGTAFQVMRVELMNCPVKYEDPVEEQDPKRKQQPISAPKMVTLKSIVVTAFKTLQECVGQNRNCQNMPKMDRQPGRTKFSCGSQTRSMGVARLPRTDGTLQNGYIRNVPLPRVIPWIKSASHVTGHGADPNTCYSQVSQVSTWSNLGRLLQGLGRRQLLPLFPCWLM
jgi:hypothetical protein